MVSDIVNALKVLYNVGTIARQVMEAYHEAAAWDLMCQAVIDAETNPFEKEYLRMIKDTVAMDIFVKIAGTSVKGILAALKDTSVPGGDQADLAKAQNIISTGYTNVEKYKVSHTRGQRKFKTDCDNMYAGFSSEYESNVKSKMKDQAYSTGYSSVQEMMRDRKSDYALHEKLLEKNSYNKLEANIINNQEKKENDIKSKYSLTGQDSTKKNRDNFRQTLQGYSDGMKSTAIKGSNPTWTKVGKHRILLTRPVLEQRWKQYNELRIAAPLVNIKYDAKQFVPQDPKALITNMKNDQKYFDSVNDAWEGYRGEIYQQTKREESDKKTNLSLREVTPPGNGLTVYKLALMMAICAKIQMTKEGRVKETNGGDIYTLATLISLNDFKELNWEDMEKYSAQLDAAGVTYEDLRDAQRELTPKLFNEFHHEFDEVGAQNNDHEEMATIVDDPNIKAHLNNEEKYLIETIAQAAKLMSLGTTSTNDKKALLHEAVALSQQLIRLRANNQGPKPRLGQPISSILREKFGSGISDELDDSIMQIEKGMGAKYKVKDEGQRLIENKSAAETIQYARKETKDLSTKSVDQGGLLPSKYEGLAVLHERILDTLAHKITLIERNEGDNSTRILQVDSLLRAAKAIDVVHIIDRLTETRDFYAQKEDQCFQKLCEIDEKIKNIEVQLKSPGCPQREELDKELAQLKIQKSKFETEDAKYTAQLNIVVDQYENLSDEIQRNHNMSIEEYCQKQINDASIDIAKYDANTNDNNHRFGVEFNEMFGLQTENYSRDNSPKSPINSISSSSSPSSSPKSIPNSPKPYFTRERDPTHIQLMLQQQKVASEASRHGTSGTPILGADHHHNKNSVKKQ